MLMLENIKLINLNWSRIFIKSINKTYKLKWIYVVVSSIWTSKVHIYINVNVGTLFYSNRSQGGYIKSDSSSPLSSYRCPTLLK